MCAQVLSRHEFDLDNGLCLSFAVLLFPSAAYYKDSLKIVNFAK